MGNDSLKCYKPQWCSAVKWPGEGGGGQLKERGRWSGACRLDLFSHSLMKRTSFPQGVLEFLASGRMWDICPSANPQQTDTCTFFCFSPRSCTSARPLKLGFDLWKKETTDQFVKSSQRFRRFQLFSLHDTNICITSTRCQGHLRTLQQAEIVV